MKASTVPSDAPLASSASTMGMMPAALLRLHQSEQNTVIVFSGY